MSKRSWQEANLPSPRGPVAGLQRAASSVSPQSFASPGQTLSPKKSRSSFDEPPLIAKAPPKPQRTNSSNGAQQESSKLPGISRKVKACAACRKQKVDLKSFLHGRILTDVCADKMYHDRRSAVPKVQRTRTVMSFEQEPANTYVRRFQVEGGSDQGCDFVVFCGGRNSADITTTTSAADARLNARSRDLLRQ